MHRFSELLLDTFFPYHCPGCGVVVGKGVCMCEECEQELEYLEDLPWQSFFPAEISGEKACFDAASALFYYDGTAKRSVLSYKFRNATHFGEYAAERMLLKIGSDIPDNIDVVTSVPMHAVNRRARGYDQAELFARLLADKLRTSYDNTLLGHRFRRKSQHKRKAAERASSAKETYFIRDDTRSLDGKNVLICDDIFTTGSTINACAKLLKQMGAEKVFAAVICLKN
ncbi:MAG: ComF family protein [Ruminococcus sp.]|nr:ComF family protein [Ruminococcus sp.]